jgi:acyl-CoA reductase-like NAD-dependent aldehyde dehydrogenase
MHLHTHWINGKPYRTREERIEVINPATGQVLETIPRGSVETAAAAVAAARKAFEVWRWVAGIEKATLLHHVAREIRSNAKELTTLMTLEGGKPFCENHDEVEWTAACFDYYAEIGRNERGRSLPPVYPHQINFTIKEPYGVVACLTPWNYPLLLLSWKVAPALAAGNTIVIKPSTETPMATLALAEAFSVLPPGVVNIVTGHGSEIGEALVTSRDVDLVALTGSVETGRRLAEACSKELKPTHLELGGKDPFIVCDDVDISIAAEAAVWAGCLNAGQVCTSAERFYVFASVFDEFVAKATAFAKTLRLGDPLDPTTDIGPMISEAQLKKVDEQVQAAIRDGATLHCGGRRAPHLKDGFYYEPTILTNIRQDMQIMQEETFGPVLPIMPVANLDEAIKLANDSRFALGANLYTSKLDYAMRAMEHIRAGTFWINDPLTDNDAGPFGGSRQTGNSRELGEEGLDQFRHTKHVHLDYKIERKSYWYPYWKYNQVSPPTKPPESAT